MFPRRPLWKHMLLACLKHTAPVQISDMSVLAQALGKIQETSTVLWKLNLSQRQTSYLIRKQEQRQAANQLYIDQQGKKMLKNPRCKLLLFSVLRKVFFLSVHLYPFSCSLPYPSDGSHSHKVVALNFFHIFTVLQQAKAEETPFTSGERDGIPANSPSQLRLWTSLEMTCNEIAFIPNMYHDSRTGVQLSWPRYQHGTDILSSYSQATNCVEGVLKQHRKKIQF